MSEKVYDYSKIAKKRMAAVALVFDEQGNILIAKPTYRDNWLIPGGIVEENESPYTACIREMKEELGIDIPLNRLICIDYLSANDEMTEGIHFVFDGGVLKKDVIQKIKLQEKELSEFQFISPEDSLPLVNKVLAGRMLACVKAAKEGRTIYMEDQKQLLQ